MDGRDGAVSANVKSASFTNIQIELFIFARMWHSAFTANRLLGSDYCLVPLSFRSEWPCVFSIYFVSFEIGLVYYARGREGVYRTHDRVQIKRDLNLWGNHTKHTEQHLKAVFWAELKSWNHAKYAVKILAFKVQFTTRLPLSCCHCSKLHYNNIPQAAFLDVVREE